MDHYVVRFLFRGFKLTTSMKVLSIPISIVSATPLISRINGSTGKLKNNIGRAGTKMGTLWSEGRYLANCSNHAFL